MIGERVVDIQNAKVHYRFTLERKISIIKGNSGIGKSVLYNLFDSLTSSKRGTGVHCNCTDSIVVLRNETNWEDCLNNSGKIIVADENIEYLYDRDFLNTVQNSDNYFIFITRSSRLGSLAYSVDNIYTLETSIVNGNPLTHFIKRYNDTSLNTTFIPEIVLTEDSNAGFTMFSSIFSCTTDHADGKDKVYDKITEVFEQGYRSIYVIVDGAGFGNCVERILNRYGKYDSFALFAPESFEYLLLKCCCFKGLLGDELVRTYDFCDSALFSTWERYYTHLTDVVCKRRFERSYSKDHLSKIFRTEAVKQDIINQLSDISKYVFLIGDDNN